MAHGLVEVGTTNRTRLGDYATALQIHDCGAVLKVHPSNFRVDGFVADVPVRDLAELAHDRDVPLIHDLGSGLLDSDTPWLGAKPAWLSGEPGARQSIEAGADLVTFSGDKLVGGPQAGIIVGSAEAVDRLRRNPLARALRIDAMTDAALAATLEAYANGEANRIPIWHMATLDRVGAGCQSGCSCHPGWRSGPARRIRRWGRQRARSGHPDTADRPGG